MFKKKSVAVICALSLIITQCFVIGVSAKDRTAPAFRSSVPRNGQTGISTTVKISLKFSENIYKSSKFTKIKLTKSGRAITITRSIYKNYLKIGHKYALAYSSWYVLSVPAYSVKDKAGNILKKTLTIKFKTKAKSVPTPTKTPTPTITPTPTPTVTPTETPINTINEAWSVAYHGYTPNWQSNARSLGTANTGYEVINFDVTPKVLSADSMIGYVDSSTVFANTDTDYWYLGICVRLNGEGYFDAMDGNLGDEGGGLGATLSYLKYAVNTKYHVEIRVNTAAKKYSVWVTPEGGTKTLIAYDFNFRLYSKNFTAKTAMDDVGKVVFAGDTTDNSFKIENHTIAHATAPASTPAPTATPAPAAGTATVNNNTELATALANTSIGHVTLAGGPYTGFTISKPVEIIGGGVTVSSAITINSGNVTVDNVNVVLGALYMHAYNVNAGLKGVIIKNGSIRGFNYISNTASGGSRGIVVSPSFLTELTVDNVDFFKLRSGITADDGYFAGCKLTAINNTFASDVSYAIGGTENATIVNISGNSFTAGIEGIGLGTGCAISVAGQSSLTMINYLKTNNTFSGYGLTIKIKDVADYR